MKWNQIVDNVVKRIVIVSGKLNRLNSAFIDRIQIHSAYYRMEIHMKWILTKGRTTMKTWLWHQAGARTVAKHLSRQLKAYKKVLNRLGKQQRGYSNRLLRHFFHSWHLPLARHRVDALRYHQHSALQCQTSKLWRYYPSIIELIIDIPADTVQKLCSSHSRRRRTSTSLRRTWV